MILPSCTTQSWDTDCFIKNPSNQLRPSAFDSKSSNTGNSISFPCFSAHFLLLLSLSFPFCFFCLPPLPIAPLLPRRGYVAALRKSFGPSRFIIIIIIIIIIIMGVKVPEG